LIDKSQVKAPKNENIIRWHFNEGAAELLYIITQKMNQLLFTLYKVDKNLAITKIKSQDNPIFKEINGGFNG
jgi:hypothetical protein